MKRDAGAPQAAGGEAPVAAASAGRLQYPLLYQVFDELNHLSWTCCFRSLPQSSVCDRRTMLSITRSSLPQDMGVFQRDRHAIPVRYEARRVVGRRRERDLATAPTALEPGEELSDVADSQGKAEILVYDPVVL